MAELSDVVANGKAIRTLAVDSADAAAVAAAVCQLGLGAYTRISYPRGRGITLGASQETKTKTALEFFSARLEQEEAGG
jgi:exopolyphosphatase/guanosine-5'-triphosphate,3'-diphosphate pyrophosphatase